LQQIEEQVNNWIGEAHAAHVSEMPLTEASKGAIAMFNEKYGDQVREDIPGVSMELCGGTHEEHR